jgi:hypothetical protein
MLVSPLAFRQAKDANMEVMIIVYFEGNYFEESVFSVFTQKCDEMNLAFPKSEGVELVDRIFKRLLEEVCFSQIQR